MVIINNSYKCAENLKNPLLDWEYQYIKEIKKGNQTIIQHK